ncbi:MAG: serine/threonine-protein kinase, partial [bacterium]
MTDSGDGLFQRVAEALGDQYDLIRLLGKGGMASVFLAREHALKRLVAIKVLDPGLSASEDYRTRFQREAETAAQLHHPNIVPIYRVGASGDLAYFTMAYVDGESLGARLRRLGRFPVEEALRVTREVTAALGSAHRRGIIHRDIKPSNVLF